MTIDEIKAKAEGMGLRLFIIDDLRCEIYHDADLMYLYPRARFIGEGNREDAATLLAALDKDAVGFEQHINDEPEFPGEMPDGLYATYQSDVKALGEKAALENMCRASVRVTKSAIISRLGPCGPNEEYIVTKREKVTG